MPETILSAPIKSGNDNASPVKKRMATSERRASNKGHEMSIEQACTNPFLSIRIMNIEAILYPAVHPLPPADYVRPHDMDGKQQDDGLRICNVCGGAFAEEGMAIKQNGDIGKSCKSCSDAGKERSKGRVRKSRAKPKPVVASTKLQDYLNRREQARDAIRASVLEALNGPTATAVSISALVDMVGSNRCALLKHLYVMEKAKTVERIGHGNKTRWRLAK